MKEITAADLKQKMDNKENFQLIDVREDYEYENANIEGDFIPMGTIQASLDKIAKDKEVVIMCRSGRRSASVIDMLEKNFGFTNLYNLKGGILEYAAEIDPSLDVE
jgi:rhodanese-related sulfurtransferase